MKLLSLIPLLSCMFICNAIANNVDLNTVLPKNCLQLGEFTQERQLPQLEHKLSSSGKFIFDCNKGLLWHTASPITETFLYRNSGSSLQFDETGAAADLDSVLQKKIGQILNKILSGDRAYIEKNFIATTIDQGIAFIPKKSRLKKHLQEIYLERKDEATLVIMRMGQQGESRLQLFNLSEPAQLNAAQCKNYSSAMQNACNILTEGQPG